MIHLPNLRFQHAEAGALQPPSNQCPLELTGGPTAVAAVVFFDFVADVEAVEIEIVHVELFGHVGVPVEDHGEGLGADLLRAVGLGLGMRSGGVGCGDGV